MKIGVLHIIMAHFQTLRNVSTGKMSILDILVFFVLPILAGIAIFFTNLKIDKEFYNLSITFYGIFIALLLNIQVAIFGVFQRNWNKPPDEIEGIYLHDKIEQKRTLLRELNINVSYLIVLSCLYLGFYIILFCVKSENMIINTISAFLYTHFILTLLMTVKRTYALFQGEYDIGS